MKKRWMIVGVLAVIALIGIIVAVQQGGKSPDEKQAEEWFPQIQEIGSAPEIKCFPKDGLQLNAEINQEHWERLGTLSLEVEVKNKTDMTLLRALVTHTLIEKSGKVLVKDSSGVGSEVSNIDPGEVDEANLEMLVVAPKAQDIERVEISLKEIQFSQETAVSPPDKPQIEEPTEQQEVSVATNYLKNPKSPGEVTVAFFFYYNEEKYTEAVGLLSERARQQSGGAEALASVHHKLFLGRKLQKVELYEPTESEDESSFNFAILQLEGGRETRIEEVDLIKENGAWRIDLIALD